MRAYVRLAVSVRSVIVGGVLLAGLAVARPSMAQPFTLDDKIKPTEIKLEPYHAGSGHADGRLYGAVITQTQATQYFFVQGISIYSPDDVRMAAEDPSAPIKVSLHKDTWDQPSIRGQTDGTGHWEAKFKTTGSFGIKVVPASVPARYAILVWVGNEIDAPPASPFNNSAGPPTGHRPIGRTILFIVAGVLMVVIVAVAWRKFTAVRMGVVVVALIASPSWLGTAHAQESGYPKAVADMLEQLKSFLEHQESVKDFWEALTALSADEAVPDESSRGPSLPSSCVNSSWQMPSNSTHAQDCQCMATAVDKLRKNRQMLEKLRILVANQKTFVNKATALGNSYAQLHTLLGLQWIGIRTHDIEEPYAQFKVISNQKHQQLMAAIETDLKDIGECEAKRGEADWYQKFGFIYYEFLYAAYNRRFDPERAMRPLAFVLVAPWALLAAVDAPAHIPLQPGVTIVTALSDRQGDYESMKTVETVTPDAVTLTYSADLPAPAGAAGGKARQVSTRRKVRREDLRTAHEYMQVFNPASPETIPGTTAIGTSTAVLTELKTTGQSAFTFQTPGRQPSMDKVLAALMGPGSTQTKGLDDLGKQLNTNKASGILMRVESSAAPFPVLINGRRTTVPAIHARGTFDELHADFYFLDDPDNPIALKWTTGSPTGALQVVQITYPTGEPTPQIEQALKESGRAEIHGIYFNFGSATLKPESEPVLKEIAEVVAKNPTWRLSVEGHTDNIGGDAANLDLSKRRADAVKQALSTRYHVDADRLTVAGFGATRPKESNDSPEGRARNRRVELVR